MSIATPIVIAESARLKYVRPNRLEIDEIDNPEVLNAIDHVADRSPEDGAKADLHNR